MRTFSEHQHRIRTFVEVINEDDTKDLLKDLENISVNDSTYSLDDISDAFHEHITEDKFADEEWVDVKIDTDFDVEVSSSGGSTDLEIKWAGSIDKENVDVTTLVSTVVDALESNDDNYDQKRYTAEEVEEALEMTDWDDYVAIESDEAEAEITNTSEGDNTATVEYQLKDGSYFLTAQIDDMWTEFTGHLGE